MEGASKRRRNSSAGSQAPPTKKSLGAIIPTPSSSRPNGISHAGKPPTTHHKPPKYEFVVAIDVGTTFTRTRYLRQETRRIQAAGVEREFTARTINNTNWQKQPMVPTVCALNLKDNRIYFGDEAEERLADADEDDTFSDWVMLRYFKLFFCEPVNDGSSGELQNVGRQALEAHRAKVSEWCEAAKLKPWGLLSKFLAYYWKKYVKPQMHETFAKNDPDFATYPVRVILTRSSLWGPRVDDDFVQAAEEAFGDDVTIGLFDEAIAAVGGAVMDANDRKASFVSLNNAELLLDLGGGTADCCVILYTREYPLRLVEVVPPAGGPFGGAIIIEILRTILEDKVKPAYLASCLELDDTSRWDAIRERLLKKFAEGIRSFEGAPKNSTGSVDLDNPEDWLEITARGFDGVNNDELTKAGYRFRRAKLLIAKKEVERLFHFCLAGIYRVAKEQFKAASAAIEKRNSSKEFAYVRPEVKSVHVLGGFSTTPYVKERLRRRLTRLIDDFRIHFSHASISIPLVASGGLYYGVEHDFLESRVLRTSFGIVQKVEWDDESYPPIPRSADVDKSPLTGVDVAYDMIRMLWYKDERIGHYAERKLYGTYWIPAEGDPFFIQEALWSVDKFDPQYEAHVQIDPDTDTHWVAWSDESEEALGLDEMNVVRVMIDDLEHRPWTAQHGSRSMVSEGRTYWVVDYEITSAFDGLRHKMILNLPVSGHIECKEASCPGSKPGRWRSCPGRDADGTVRYERFEFVSNIGQALGSVPS